MELVKAKKHLGQHFLKDLNIAQKIADTLSLKDYNKVIEIKGRDQRFKLETKEETNRR